MTTMVCAPQLPTRYVLNYNEWHSLGTGKSHRLSGSTADRGSLDEQDCFGGGQSCKTSRPARCSSHRDPNVHVVGKIVLIKVVFSCQGKSSWRHNFRTGCTIAAESIYLMVPCASETRGSPHRCTQFVDLHSMTICITS